MATYDVFNGSASALTDIDGSTDVPAYSAATGVTLNSTQLLALLTNAGVAVLKGSATASQKHWASKIMRIGSNPGA